MISSLSWDIGAITSSKASFAVAYRSHTVAKHFSVGVDEQLSCQTYMGELVSK